MTEASGKQFLGWIISVLVAGVVFSAVSKIIDIYFYTPIMNSTDLGNEVYLIVFMVGMLVMAGSYFGFIKVKMPKKLRIE